MVRLGPDERRLAVQLGLLGGFGVGMGVISVSRPFSRKRKTYREELEDMRRNARTPRKRPKRFATNSLSGPLKRIVRRPQSTRGVRRLDMGGEETSRALVPYVAPTEAMDISEDGVVRRAGIGHSYKMKRNRRFRKAGRHGPGTLKGHSMIIEKGAELTAPSATALLDFGVCNFPPKGILDSVFKSILRKFAQEIGQEFTNWSDVPSFVFAATPTHRISIAYLPNSTSTSTAAHINLVGAVSWGNLAEQLLEALLANITASTFMRDDMTFLKLYYNVIATAEVIHSMSLQNLKVHISSRMVAKLQNRTTGKATTNTEADDVTANPVVVRQIKVGGNGFITKAFGTIPASTNVCENSGYCAQVQDPTVTVLEDPRMYKYLKGVTTTVLQPGQVMKTTLYSNYHLSLGRLFTYMLEWVSQALASNSYNPVVRFPLGKSLGYVIDKAMDTRSGASPIVVGEERITYVRTWVSTRHPIIRREVFKP